MLTEQEIREMSARRWWALVLGMAGAVAGMFLAMIGMFSLFISFKEPLGTWVASRLGDTVRDMIPGLAPLSGMVIFFPTICFAAHFAQRFKMLCPSCHKDILPGGKRLVLTRCCPECNERIVAGGRTHSATVYRRYCHYKERRLFGFFLWLGPALAVMLAACEWLDRSALAHRPSNWVAGPFMGGMFGAGTNGYIWLRTFDRRCIAPLAVSVILLVLSVYLFWRVL